MYKDMLSLLEERDGENGWKIQKFRIKSNDFRAMRDGIMPGEYVRLCHNDNCVMSNTRMEKKTNEEFCIKAYGDIIIGGLGLGMIIMAIQDKPEVNSITVIEKNQEVIDLVASQLKFNDKVKIIHEDVFEWKPEHGIKYHMVYMDIWAYINRDVYEKEMKPLKRKYSRYLYGKKENPNRYNKCWAEYQAKTGKELY